MCFFNGFGVCVYFFFFQWFLGVFLMWFFNGFGVFFKCVSFNRVSWFLVFFELFSMVFGVFWVVVVGVGVCVFYGFWMFVMF